MTLQLPAPWGPVDAILLATEPIATPVLICAHPQQAARPATALYFLTWGEDITDAAAWQLLVPPIPAASESDRASAPSVCRPTGGDVDPSGGLTLRVRAHEAALGRDGGWPAWLAAVRARQPA